MKKVDLRESHNSEVVLEEIQPDKEVHKAKARALGSVSYESEELIEFRTHSRRAPSRCQHEQFFTS